MNDIDFSGLTKDDCHEALAELEAVMLRALNLAKVNGDADQVEMVEGHLRRFWEKTL